MKHCLCIVLLTTVMQLAAKEQKLTGEVSDPAALAAIESYCVDTRQLADDQAYQIRGFLRGEQAPRASVEAFVEARSGLPRGRPRRHDQG